MNLTIPHIHFVGIGLGLRRHLTFGAEEQLLRSAYVYVMATENSWIVNFVSDVVGRERVRAYMPRSVKWNSGWQDDNVFSIVADEVEDLVVNGQHVAFAMAGDVAIYGNVADSIVPIFQQREFIWDVFPGVSFLNALSMVTGEPLVGETDNFLVTFAQNHWELDEAFKVANILVLYNPGGFINLQEYIEKRHIGYARLIRHGVYGSDSKQVDLTSGSHSQIAGIVILKRPEQLSSLGVRQSPKSYQQLEFHIGTNGWNSKQQFFAVCYPNKLMWAPSGEPEQLVHRHVFPGSPNDIRGFFIDSQDALYVSLKGHKKGAFGKTYISRDDGKSFELAFEQSCWGFDEDGVGNLFGGVYHEKGEPNASCSVLWTGDHGKTWVDIAPPEWINQTHVHHIAVNPATSWLYVCLGDIIGLRGCWRAKITSATLARTSPAGSCDLELSYLDSESIYLREGNVLYLSCGIQAVVQSIDGRYVKLQEPLQRTADEGIRVLSADWCLKISDVNNTLQFIGIVFKNGNIFLANDSGPKKNEQRTVVFKAYDDGSDMPIAPFPVLQTDCNYGWGSFYLELDREERIWVGLRPIKGKGAIWVTTDGEQWTLFDETPEEDLPCWRGTHTFRDGTLGATGDGRYLCAPASQIIVTELNWSKQLIVV